MQQLDLFTPNIKEVTIEWLFEYCQKLDKNFKREYCVVRGDSLKLEKKGKWELKISLSNFYSDTPIKEFISLSYQKKYGDYNGVGIPISSVQEFKEQIKKALEIVREY